MGYKTYTSYNKRHTPQSEPATNRQVKNNAGGYVFGVDKWTQLERFLILGTEGGTYYVNQNKLTKKNAGVVEACIKEDGIRTVNTIVAISKEGRAVKNDPALFALAMCASLGDYKTRAVALDSLSEVARIFTHLAHFLEYTKLFRGWGRGLRRAVGNWYNFKEPSYVAYQMVKYRQRDGWTHQDVIRLSHPKPRTELHNYLYGYAVGKNEVKYLGEVDKEINILEGYELAKRTKKESSIVNLIETYGLTREMIPNEFLKSAKVWEALYNDGKMPIHALVRNLGNMSKSGLLVDGNFSFVNHVASTLTDRNKIVRSRLHPLSILTALKTYSSGQGWRGSGNWEVSTKIIDALDEAFYLAFDAVEPTGKNIFLACDVSGSMISTIAGMNISACEATGALALVTARREPNTIIKGFSSGDGIYPNRNTLLEDINISPRQRLDDVVRTMLDMNFGRTDCALPMVWALQNQAMLDAFVILTDNETWHGKIHPFQALRDYRNAMNPNAKLIVVGMTSTGFSIADPEDAGSLDIVGMDTSIPTLINNFIKD